jgi:hypothetical protein
MSNRSSLFAVFAVFAVVACASSRDPREEEPVGTDEAALTVGVEEPVPTDDDPYGEKKCPAKGGSKECQNQMTNYKCGGGKVCQMDYLGTCRCM